MQSGWNCHFPVAPVCVTYSWPAPSIIKWITEFRSGRLRPDAPMSESLLEAPPSFRVVCVSELFTQTETQERAYRFTVVLNGAALSSRLHLFSRGLRFTVSPLHPAASVTSRASKPFLRILVRRLVAKLFLSQRRFPIPEESASRWTAAEFEWSVRTWTSLWSKVSGLNWLSLF